MIEILISKTIEIVMRVAGVAMQTNSLSVSALSNELSIVFYRGVVQLEERGIWDAEAQGSSPCTSTT